MHALLAGTAHATAGLQRRSSQQWRQRLGPAAVPAAVRRRPGVGAAAAALDVCTLSAVASGMDGALYELGQQLDSLVSASLTDVTPASAGVVLLAGLLTSLSPCTLSVLPLTIGYIGGYSEPEIDGDDADTAQTQTTQPQAQSSSELQPPPPPPGTSQALAQQALSPPRPPRRRRASAPRLGLQALAFSFGLASSLAGLGVASSLAGRAYGSVGPGLPAAVALLAIAMGLNLLQVVSLPLPSLMLDVRAARLPAPLTAYLAGATFALAASPCSSPVLASLLGYVAASGSPGTGGLLLLAYSCGYVAPLLVAASATGTAKRLLQVRRYSAWVTPASGVLLVGGGTYALLTRLAG